MNIVILSSIDKALVYYRRANRSEAVPVRKATTEEIGPSFREKQRRRRRDYQLESERDIERQTEI